MLYTLALLLRICSLEKSMNLIDPILEFQHEIQAIRRDIHAHPELCFYFFLYGVVV